MKLFPIGISPYGEKVPLKKEACKVTVHFSFLFHIRIPPKKPYFPRPNIPPPTFFPFFIFL